MANTTMTLMEIMQHNYEIFPKDYAFYNESMRKQFEEKFLGRYMFSEIGFDSPVMFKHFFKNEMAIIYPYYEHLYRTTSYIYDPTLNYDVKEEIKRELENDSTTTGGGTSKNTDYNSPRITTSDYKKSPTLITENENNSDVSTNGKQIETHTRTTKGNIGVMTTQDLIMKERQIIINIDEEIIDRLKCLFMGVF